jgi:hypothetical protein
MNIREAILAEHSREHALRIATYAIQNKKKFKELMHCYMDPDYRLSQRAAWSVSWAARKNPAMIQPYIGELVKRLQDDTVHPAVIRNAVRVLEELDIPEEYHGEVMNSCFQFLQSPTTPAAIKAFSMTVLYHLSKYYPEIKQELKLIIEENWEHETPAFKSRGRKILKTL